MKETVKTSRTAGYLEKIFRALNARYFEGQLEEPIITIQSTPRAYGHVTVAKSWHKANGEQRHELNHGAGDRSRGGVRVQERREHYHTQAQQHPQADLSLLRSERQSHTRRQYPLWGLHGKDGGLHGKDG